MLATIEFHDKLPIEATELCHKRSEGLLPAKLRTGDLASTQLHPEPVLRLRLSST